MTNSESKKILILSLSGIGNFLMQSPTIEALRKAYPIAHITLWVAPRGTPSLAKRNPHIDEVIEEPIKRSLWGHTKLIWRLRREKYDIGIILSPGQLIKSALYLFLAGIPRRIGHAYPFFSQETSFLLTHSVPEDSSFHDIEQNTRLLALLGIRHSDLGIRHYSLTIPLSAQKRGEDLMYKFSASTPACPVGRADPPTWRASSQRLVGFHPGSAPTFVWKRWPLKHWTELGKKLTEKNYHLLIFGGPDETKLKRKLHARLSKNSTIIETDLFTTAAIMQKCEFFVSNDSGLMHVAAAAGVKTFGLFGPTDERQTGPRGKDSHVIRAPGTAPVYHTEKNFDLGTRPHETLKALTPEYVLQHLLS